MIEFDEALSFLLKKSVEPQKVEKVLVARSFNRAIAFVPAGTLAPVNILAASSGCISLPLSPAAIL